MVTGKAGFPANMPKIYGFMEMIIDKELRGYNSFVYMIVKYHGTQYSKIP
jgi:hypothetical protein